MKALRLSIITLTAGLFVSAGWFGLRQYQKHRRYVDCLQRDAAFYRRIENIKQDAREQLKIGTKKANVSDFFVKHKMNFDISELEASGILDSTGGCAPLGCGTDRVMIRVTVNVNSDGTVRNEPIVDYMYADCV